MFNFIDLFIVRWSSLIKPKVQTFLNPHSTNDHDLHPTKPSCHDTVPTNFKLILIHPEYYCTYCVPNNQPNAYRRILTSHLGSALANACCDLQYCRPFDTEHQYDGCAHRGQTTAYDNLGA